MKGGGRRHMSYTTKDEKRFVNCTLSGPVSVYVRDGKIVRIMPLEYNEDDAAAWSIEARGHTFTRPNKAGVACWIQGSKQYVYSKDRLLTPVKRVDFDPEGNRNPQNRGKSGYEPISWDEALDIIAKEVIRIRRQYGPSAIAVTGSSHDSWGTIQYRMSAMDRFWNILGCTWIDHNPESWEGFFWGAIHTWGFYWRLGQPPAYDLLEDTFKHTDMIVFWSSDPTTTSGDYANNETDRWRFHMKKLGIKFVFIDPFCNYTAVLDGDKWLTPRPGTDTTIALAIAFTWITEDLYDKEYVETHTHGFDKWKAYVLGEEDDVPKTPKWAEEKSGVKARDIIALAREWGTKRTTLAPGGRAGMSNSGRAAYGHEFTRMMVILAAMQGLGKPGVNVYSTTGGAPADWNFYFPGYADGGISGGSSGSRELGPRGFPERPVGSQIRQRICRTVLPECVMNPPVTWRGVYGYYGQSTEQQFTRCDFPFEGFSQIKMLFRQGASYIGTMMQTNRWVQMYRHPDLEFALNVCPFKTEPEARLSDIILPAASTFEGYDIAEWARISGYSRHVNPVNARVIVLMQKCIEPLGQSRSRYDIYAAMAERLNIKEQFTLGRTEYEWCKRTFEVTDLSKVMSWEEFEKKGYYVVPIPKDYKPTPAFRWFYEGRARDTLDWGPGIKDVASIDGKGLATPTGKIEFESESLKRFDPNDEERPPVPHYIPSWEGIETTELLKRFPLQLISPHPRFTFHSQHDGKSCWNEEIPHHRRLKDGYRYWVLRMNPKDAAKRGIKDGDLAKVYNDRGVILTIVTVTPRIIEGVVHSYSSGGGYDPMGEPGDPKTIDKGGTINQLTNARFISKNCPGMAPNSCLVEIEKWEGGDA
jgi:anaerobic selenocysteine-containing dehydrogenase